LALISAYLVEQRTRSVVIEFHGQEPSMSIWGKLAGAPSGLAVGGPIGALVGGVAGHYIIDHEDEDAPAANQLAFTVA
jgi:hypothetical protein